MLFETKRILCRNMKVCDFEDIHRYAQNEEVVKYMAWGPNTEEETQRFLDCSIEGSLKEPRLEYELAIIDKNTEEFVGGIALYILSKENRVAEIGYSIIPEYWGNGYASEATMGMIKFALETLKLHRIEGKCDVRNIGSAKVMEKAGMIREGRIREHILLRDGWRDSYLYSVLESDDRVQMASR